MPMSPLSQKLKNIYSKKMSKFSLDFVRGYKYKALIRETEGLCKEFLFPNLPPCDEKELSLMASLKGTGIIKAFHLKNFLIKSLNLEGDICEFGVAQGSTSAFLAYLVRNTTKNIWLFDSFLGLSRPSAKDLLINDAFGLGSIEAYEGKMACSVNLVKKELARIKFPNNRTKIIPGFIEQTIKSINLPGKVCFAYLDFDFYEPTVAALNFLDKTLQKSGFIVVDDYDFFSTGAKIAVDEFMAEHTDEYKFSLPAASAGGKFCMLERTV